MLLAEDDQGGHAAEGVSAVGFHPRHPADAALPVLAPGGGGWGGETWQIGLRVVPSPTCPQGGTPALTWRSTRPSRRRARA